MTKFNPFRVSFDKPLGSGERRRAQFAATVVAGTAILLGVTSAFALLNASSEKLGDWSNASEPPDVRMLAREGEDPAGKPCDAQTWPYIEARCLKLAHPKATARTTPKQGLGSQQVSLPNPPAAPTTATAPAATAGTTGAASDDAPAADVTTLRPAREPVRNTSSIVLPEPDPRGEVVKPRDEAKPRLSPREQRRLDRAERIRLQRERRAEAKRARQERAKARAKARAEARENRRRARSGERIVRRWTEYTYESPSGGSRRVIVIRQGSPDDEFFRTIR
ncbi:MAG: hypothetical protein AB7V13_10820 [Pseudorhodoplanes sp.]|uniref:hypothetical protein n=1 Tax=Pseudorhodoplanes sp. TaxID=1934341 RepID=UPI003D10184A